MKEAWTRFGTRIADLSVLDMLTMLRVEEWLRIAQESGVVTDHNRQIPLASRVQKFTSVVLLDKFYANLRSVLRPQYAGLSLASILTGVFVAFLIQPIESSFLKICISNGIFDDDCEEATKARIHQISEEISDFAGFSDFQTLRSRKIWGVEKK